MMIFVSFKCYVVTWTQIQELHNRKMNFRCLSCHLLRIHLVLIVTSSVWSASIANRASAPNFDLLANGSVKEEQMMSQIEWSKKESQVTKERLHVVDQLLLDDADEPLSSGATNLPETFPTAENVAPGRTDSTRFRLQEVTGARHDASGIGDEGDTGLMQVQSVDFRRYSFMRTEVIRHCAGGILGGGGADL
jgi:hypothetical protein